MHVHVCIVKLLELTLSACFPETIAKYYKNIQHHDHTLVMLSSMSKNLG